MNKKVLVFLLVLVGLGGFVWWKTSAPQSAQDRLAQAMRIMEGLQSQAIPTALTADQLSLLEQVYQDSLERIPNIQAFRTTDKNKLIDTLKTSNFGGTGTNGLNTTGEKILSMSLARTDDFNTYLTSGFTSDVGVVATKDQIKKLAQSINTLTNDIRLTTLYISWYEGIRGKVCTTNDPTNDPYVSGEVKLLYAPSPSLRDTCGDNEVKQFKCTNGLYEDDASHVETTSCPNGCSNGVCLREAAPTLSFDMPSTGAINSPISVRVSANTGYSQPFFIIIAGDDDATFPTGALRIMSGEVVNNMVSRNFEIKFSKAGTMTVTIRPKEGAEVSKTIVIGGGSVAQCGNGIKEGDEQCDDGNTTNGDDCSNTCSQENGALYFQAANKLASKGIITDFSAKPIEYRLADLLTRYDAIRAAANARGGVLENESSYACTGVFSDIGKTVPTCRVAELAQKAGLIGSSNVFRPNDRLSKFEAVSLALNSVKLIPMGSHTMNEILQYAVEAKLISTASGFASNAAITRGEYFYYLVQALAATEEPDICTLDPNLCPTPRCGNGKKEGSEECDDGNTNNTDSCSNICKNNVTIASATCTGSRPINSVINAGAGSASRAWTYDGSPTGPYQNCTFRCQTGYLYTNGACTQAQITQPSCPAVLTPTCTNGTLTDNGVDANGCPKAKTCTLNTLTSTTLTTPVCPLYTTPTCTDGTLVDGGKDANGCPKALTCVKNTVTCPVYTAPAANFCTGGQVIDGGLDANGCQRPATCGPKLTTGAVTIDGAKDCWFGDATKKITIGDFIGYQSSANSGLKYLDEILLYGATAPTPTSTLTNILSYEDSLWTSADGSTPNTSTQLTNFFVFRTYSEGARTWNIPTTGTKFYGCFARGDRPNTW